MGVQRKQRKAKFKAQVAMAALAGDKTLAELSSEYGAPATMISSLTAGVAGIGQYLMAAVSVASEQEPDSSNWIAAAKVNIGADDKMFAMAPHPDLGA